MNNVENVHIHDMKIINGWTSAIRTSFSTYVIIENNRIDNATDDGITINEQTRYATVMGNVNSSSGFGEPDFGTPTGIEVQDDSHAISIVGNVIHNSTNDALIAEVQPFIIFMSCM